MEVFLISGQVGAHNKLPARTRNEIANDDLFLSHELQQCKNWKNRHKKCPTFWAWFLARNRLQLGGPPWSSLASGRNWKQRVGASFAEVERSSLVCFWGACVPVYWLAGCLLAGVGLQRHGLVGFSGMDNVGKGAIQRLQSVLPSTTKQSNEAVPCARSQPTRTTRPQPAQAGPWCKYVKKKTQKKCEKKATESSCFWDQKSVPKMGPTFFSLLKS